MTNILFTNDTTHNELDYIFKKKTFQKGSLIIVAAIAFIVQNKIIITLTKYRSLGLLVFRSSDVNLDLFC